MTYAYPDLRIPHPLLRVCGLLARQAGTKMINQFSTRMKMKQPLQHPRTPKDERLKRIEISFAEQEFTQRIRLLINNACAARGGAARMTLSDWREVETELTQTFAHGLRIRRRWFSLSRRLKTSRGEQRGPTPTRE